MAGPTKTIRCAVYTRVSTPEQAEGDFSSLQNQREMCEAYIRSQASNGWTILSQRYDDAGFSGGTIDRPALERLLRDSENGFVDCIVVAKIDRLSRSLLDFARIVDILDHSGVGFVSTSQQFDTSSSMGQLTLNILLSFAQFERQMIAERTREKVVAARRKGKWTGGTLPLGYDSVDGKLVINPDEATRVRAIFDLYLGHESLVATLAELHKRNWTTKSWTTKRDRTRNGEPFTTTSLRRLLSNPLYIGKMPLGDESYDGEHAAIIAQDTWDRVQQKLKKNGSNGGAAVKNQHGALLKGILRCVPCDSPMTLTHTRNHGRVYRYYVCTNAQKTGWENCPSKSISAEEIEQCIYERIRAIGTDTALVEETIQAARKQLAEQAAGIEVDIRIAKKKLGQLRKEKQKLLESISKGGSVARKAAERLDQVDTEMGTTGSLLSSLKQQLSAIKDQEIDPEDLKAVIAQFDPIWDVLLPRERVRIVRLLIRQVDFDGRSGTLGITFQPTGIKALLAEATTSKDTVP